MLCQISTNPGGDRNPASSSVSRFNERPGIAHGKTLHSVEEQEGIKLPRCPAGQLAPGQAAVCRVPDATSIPAGPTKQGVGEEDRIEIVVWSELLFDPILASIRGPGRPTQPTYGPANPLR